LDIKIEAVLKAQDYQRIPEGNNCLIIMDASLNKKILLSLAFLFKI